MVKSYSIVTSKELKNNSKKEHGTGNRIQVLQSELAWKWEEVIDSVMIVFE
jgi:hypothetical protein